MMIERNGVVLFPPDEDFTAHKAFRALSTVSLGDVKFTFGFFLVEENGKRYVVPATEEERRTMLLKAFPKITSEEVRAFCIQSGSGCEGNCSGLKPHRRCMRVYEDLR